MLKNKILEKLLAIILIFTLTSANFAFVTKSFASSFTETLFGTKSDTGHKNVGFEAYFGTEAEKETSVISDVNNADLAISMKLDVQKSGYLKDAKIEIAETEEGNGLNFEVKNFKVEKQEETEEEKDNEAVNEKQESLEDNKEILEEVQKSEYELPDYVQSLEDNVISMQQINSSKEISLSLPIEYKNESYVNENKFSNDCLVKFSGIYVDDAGDEIEVSREIKLNVSWKDEREVKVETAVEKYIDFSRGVILQTVVKLDSTTDKNTLPIKESNIKIKVPTFEGITPSNITVVPNSTAGTNGETAGNLNFNQDNWNYNEEDSKLEIKVTNDKKLVKVNEYEDEYLKDAEKEVVEEERYYNESGVDEYLITYTFEDAKASNIKLESEIEANIVTFSGIEKDDNINVTTSSDNYEYSVDKQIGDIVSLNIENETKEVSKAYIYSNYNNSGKYETPINTKMIINVSYKDIVEGIEVEDISNEYIDKSEQSYENNDIYYKQISISKEEFINILGEAGELRVLDLNSRNELLVINNETEVNEDGNIVISFEEHYSKLVFKTTKPVGEGNLVINNTKVMVNSNASKEEFTEFASIKTKSAIKADYTYVDEIVEVGEAEAKTNLIDTVTKANLVMDRDNLSTLAINNDVELRIELNNATEKSDVYGNSEFEIELPEYVEKLEVTNISVLYGEGLEVMSAEQEGRIIKIVLDGKQEGINSGVLTNGTNIVINANIKVNLYTPAKSDTIKLRYNNSEATNYQDGGAGELEFMYSAPTGLVAVNSTSNYNNLGTSVTSVRQGLQEDVIDIYSEAKKATMEVIVMNNNNNTVSNVSILGRIPFKGVKDIATGEDLGTTLDTKLVGGIVQDAHNSTLFNIYYSENAEATKDVNDVSNGWSMSPENLDTIKSYLLVPVELDYEMQESEILRFTYEYEIPANLTHNENIYGTFLAYYTNNSEIAVTDEETSPDKIGLTTGEGPELEIKVSANKEVAKEFSEIQVNVVATNVGNTKAENVNVDFNIPKFSEYVSYEIDNEDVNIVKENGIVKVSKSILEKDEKIEFKVNLKVAGMPTLEEYYRGTEGFGEYDGQYKIIKYDEEGNIIEEKVITEVPEIYIEPKATVSAKDLGATLTAESNKVKVTEAAFEITIDNKSDIDEDLDVQKAGDEVLFHVGVENLTEKTMKNIIVTQELPQEFSFVKAAVMGYEEDGLTSKEIAQGNYDEETRTITWKIEKLDEYAYIPLTFTIKVNEIDQSITKKDIELIAKVSADETDSYESNSVLTIIGRPVLVITQVSENTDTYIKEGDKVNYVFTVKNEGDAVADHVKLTDVIPDGIAVRKITYVSDGIVGNKKVSSSREAVIMANIKPKEELVVNIEAVASNLGGVQEKTVTNYATVSSEEIEEMQTNSVTHIVEASEKSIVSSELQSSSNNNSVAQNSNISKTYKLTGTAWIDANKDGMRNVGEELLSGIVVRLVNSETGVIKTSTTTDTNGTYTFSGIENGNYLVIFEYDTVKYTVTAYKKDGVEINVNSDAITTKLEQDGKTRNGAITDVITIANGSVSGIDIGLVLADTFDLKLDKGITRVTTQSVKGTTNDTYDNIDLAKTEIAAKYLSGSTVIVEYAITVSNIGDVSGYAKNIVDYVPEGMTFNSSLGENSSWYTGSDGNLYTSALADRELAPGESATIKLVLTRQMTAENAGIINNLAEIYEDYNIYGISDHNSTPANKAQGENDLGSADMIISVKTGETFIYISVIITTILLGSIVIFIAYNKIVLAKRKGGV